MIKLLKIYHSVNSCFITQSVLFQFLFIYNWQLDTATYKLKQIQLLHKINKKVFKDELSQVTWEEYLQVRAPEEILRVPGPKKLWMLQRMTQKGISGKTFLTKYDLGKSGGEHRSSAPAPFVGGPGNTYIPFDLLFVKLQYLFHKYCPKTNMTKKELRTVDDSSTY